MRKRAVSISSRMLTLHILDGFGTRNQRQGNGEKENQASALLLLLLLLPLFAFSTIFTNTHQDLCSVLFPSLLGSLFFSFWILIVPMET
ncbi:unnamed protein product [Citrullus colocynthis]|uniref:Uncharacterized protein n=1 Tax=Citrullus colocynthis TaxID=252529 RepID=A0ABP0Y5N0_9ROSI